MSQRIDLTGRKYGRLTVIRYDYTGKYGKAYWICNCDCGKQNISILGESLKQRKTISCGCLRSELMSTHKKSTSRIYRIYIDMVRRCKPNGSDHYGKRGIRVCEQWTKENGFEHFYDWSIANGYDDGLTIDRIDNDGDYSPDNCRWATMKQQSYNKSNNIHVAYNGKSYTLLELSELTGIDPHLLYRRLHYKHMTIEHAIELGAIPHRTGKKKILT